MPAERTYSAQLVNGLPITLRFRAVKLFRISVKPDGSIEAVAPRRMSIGHALALANERAAWAAQHREQLLARPRRDFVSGESVPLWGCEYPLLVQPGPAGAGVRAGAVVITAPDGAQRDERRGALLALYRRELERALPPLVEKYAAALGVAAPKWSLRDMHTRWGSCTSARGTVRFSLLLAALPRECLEYVVAHELAHLRIHGHGADFHALVRSVYPAESAAAKLLCEQSPL